MFKRRKPRTNWQNLRETLWPSMGFGRALVYLKHRVVRLPDSNYRVAAGLAVGASVSFTPLLGTHFIQTIIFCWLIRANAIAGLIGTAWGNPWTFPLLYWASYNMGVLVFSFFGLQEYVITADEFTLGYLLEHPLKLLLPFTLGGFVCGILFFPVAYYFFLYLIKGARRARAMVLKAAWKRKKLKQATEKKAQ